MSIKIGNTDIIDVKIGDNQISSIYAGDVLIWESKFYGILVKLSDGTISKTKGKILNLDERFSTNTNISEIIELYSNVTSMNKTFQYDTNITKANLSNADGYNSLENTSSLVNTFLNCDNMTEVILTNTNPINTTTIEGIFNSCDNLTTIVDIEDWTLPRCKVLNTAFAGCPKLTTLDLSNLILDNATSYFAVFSQDSRLTSIGNPVWKGTITNTSSMFNNCSNLTNAGNFSNMTLNNANCQAMFQNCGSLTSPITLKGSISNASNMFNGCSNLENVDISNVDFSNCTNMGSMFNGCKLNTDFEFTLTGKNLTNLVSMGAMFARRSLPKIKKVDLSGNTWRSAGVDCSQLFRWGDCETVDLRGIKCASNLLYAFYQNTIDYLDLRGFDTANVTNMNGMTDIAIEPYEIKIDSSFFNSNISVFPLKNWFQFSYRNGVSFPRSSREQEIAKLNMLFDALINHPKVNDDDWEGGQEIRLGANLNNAELPTGLLNPDCPYKDQTLIDKMNNAIDLGWTISFE